MPMLKARSKTGLHYLRYHIGGNLTKKNPKAWYKTLLKYTIKLNFGQNYLA